MDIPLFRTKDARNKIRAALYKDRLEVKSLEFNPLNKTDHIDISKVRQIRFIAPDPGSDPRRVGLAIQKEGEDEPYVLPDLDTTEAYNLKEGVERLKNAPLSQQLPDDPSEHPFTLTGRVNRRLAQQKRKVFQRRKATSRYRVNRRFRG